MTQICLNLERKFATGIINWRAVLRPLISADLGDGSYAFTDAIQAVQMYFDLRISEMFHITHNEPPEFASPRGQNRLVAYSPSGHVIAVVVIAETGYVDWSEFKPMVADSVAQEDALFNKLQNG
jgi:hypothetical protein